MLVVKIYLTILYLSVIYEYTSLIYCWFHSFILGLKGFRGLEKFENGCPRSI